VTQPIPVMTTRFMIFFNLIAAGDSQRGFSNVDSVELRERPPAFACGYEGDAQSCLKTSAAF
jgi:hypothetical protein